MEQTRVGASHAERDAHAVADDLEGASPQTILAWAIATYEDEFCLTTSLADAVLIDMASRIRPGVAVLFVDTGYHFPETLRTRQAVIDRYPVRLVDVRPAQTVAEQNAEHGPALFQRSADLCCSLRKVAPLQGALRGFRAWGSGIRRDETSNRTAVRVVEWDAGRAMVKVNPLAGWTQDQVDAYIREHDVVTNPLIAEGYPSIGCAPCTRPVLPGENARAGRWAGSAKNECGIHIGPRVSG